VSHAWITVLPSIVVPLAEPENVWTIVVAGGSGARFGRLKQYELIGDQRMIDRSVATALAARTSVVVVVPAADVAAESLRHHAVVGGGATRSESVRAGLAAVPADATIVCVHDAARPFATVAMYRAVIGAVVAGADAVVPGVAVTDTIKIVDAKGMVTATPMRESLVAVQTPQAFRAAVLREAHGALAEGTDDAALVELRGRRVLVVAGEADNRKITHPADLDWARGKVMST
jgi:2-C-methyl-D-erythritol 4-phosphate cytidylyltransferase